VAAPAGWRETELGILVPEPPPAPPPRPLLACDLFAGCGGFSLGMQQAGLDVIAAVEWEEHAAATYLLNLGSRHGAALGFVDEADRTRFHKLLKKAEYTNDSGWIGSNNPEAEGGCRAFIVGDIRRVTGDTIRETLAGIGIREPLDVVFGGPPCQGFSVSGKQNPADARNNLVHEFLRIAVELDAKVVLMENVPPLLSDKKFRPLRDAWIQRANEAGFDCVATILDAASYGVPQFRRRAFFALTRPGSGPFQFPLPTNWGLVAPVKGKRWETNHYSYTPWDREHPPEPAQGNLFDPEAA
jgi:DNA (cytosine-5)-methyltransferase 1